MKLSFQVLVILLFINTSFSQWTTQDIPNFTSDIKAVKFINRTTGWLCSSHGEIFKTIDGGTTWLAQASPVKSFLYEISFTDEKNGIIAGVNGVILKTTDGGNLWTKLTTEIPTTDFQGVSFVDANTGYVAGGNYVLKTTDGGNSWTQQYISSEFLDFIFFLDKNNGLTGRDSLFRTTDAGKTWQPVPKPGFMMYKAVMTDTNTIYIGGLYGLLYKSSDAGKTWTKKNITTCQNSCTVYDISFAGTKYGMAVGKYGFIFKTTDGGDSWTQLLDKKPAAHLFSVSLVDSLTATSVGTYGTIIHTVTGGLTDVKPESNSLKPERYELAQNYPNPFNPVTTIKYSLPKESKVNISVFNLIGQKVKELINEIKQPGIYEVKFDAGDYPTGVYFYRLSAGNFSDARKLILIK